MDADVVPRFLVVFGNQDGIIIMNYRILQVRFA